MRDDRQRLADILEAATLLQVFQTGRTRNDMNTARTAAQRLTSSVVRDW